MARFLADTLSGLNIAIAALIAILCAAIGFQWAKSTGDNLTFGAGIGLAVGLVSAAVICGTLAMLSLIESHLRLIADDVEEMRSRDAGTARNETNVG